MRGQVELTIQRADDLQVVDIIRSSNLVVDQGYGEMLDIFTGGSLTKYLRYMQFGTGIATPAVGDTTLQSPVNPVKAFATVEYEDANYLVRLTAYLLAAEGNGFRITEAGLLTFGSKLFARATFSGQQKSTDYQFQFRWELSS